MSIAGRPEQRERHGATRDGEKTIRHSEHDREARGARDRESEQCQQGERHQQHSDRKARDIERMGAARKHQFANAGRHLRGPEQRADRHDGRGIDAGATEDRQQVR